MPDCLKNTVDKIYNFAFIMQNSFTVLQEKSSEFKKKSFCLYLRNHTAVNSKVIAVTVRPEPKATESQLEIELAHLENVSSRVILNHITRHIHTQLYNSKHKALFESIITNVFISP